MRIALGQMISTGDPEHNADQVADRVRRAAADGAELVIFPEATMCAFGYPLGPVAEEVTGPWAGRITDCAAAYGCTVVAGMFTPAGDKVTNTLIATDGQQVTGYQKIHLYDAFGFCESDTVAAGADPVMIDVAGVSVGLTTCYDVRFPGLYQKLADEGAQIIVVAASWAAGPGKIEQWRLLTRARALDSTCFVAATGQADPATAGVETKPGAPTGIGYSALIGPDGVPVTELGAEPDVVICDVDTDRVVQVRQQLPVLANRRF